MSEPIVETTVREGVLRYRRGGTRWLSSGWNGGFRRANVAYNVSVPDGFARTDLDAYLAERLDRARFAEPGPALLTGLSLSHARGARSGPVTVVATAGLSNPAALPIRSSEVSCGTVAPRVDPGSDPDEPGSRSADRDLVETGSNDARSEERTDDGTGNGGSEGDLHRSGTVNVLVGTDRALPDGGLVALLGTAVEAKTATLLAETGFPGTTTDAVVVGCDPRGETETFAGSATTVGAATRACVRDAVTASLRSRYEGCEPPASVADAEYGVTTTVRTDRFVPTE